MNDCNDEMCASPALGTSPVESDNANERLLELLVGERIAERVYRTVEIADPVRDVVQSQREGTRQGSVLAREADDERQDVPWDPTDHERTEDDRDGSQSFTCAVIVSRQLLQSLPFRILHQTHIQVIHLSPMFQQAHMKLFES